MKTCILVDGIWVEGEPTENGQVYREIDDIGAIVEQTYFSLDEIDIHHIEFSDVSGQLDDYTNHDNEFTVPQQSNEVIATGQLAIPDRKFKVPFKRIDTGRIQLMPAQVVDGQLSIPLKFETNGIWVVNQELFNTDFPDMPFEMSEYRFSVI